MKIRTKLLLFLLPPLIGSITLICALLAYNWHKEIEEGFKYRLKPTTDSTAGFMSGKQAPEMTEDGWIHPSIGNSTHPNSLQITSGFKGQAKGYGSMIDQQGNRSGMIKAETSLMQIEEKFRSSLVLIILSAVLTILLMIVTLVFIANKIANPIQQLNNSALAIAAGQYGETAEPVGPKEIRELANTLNTMSECLLENINRLKENSLLRERMYGEYECSMLFQHLMLQKNIDDCQSDAVAVKSITHFSDSPRGLLLDFPKTESSTQFHIRLAEAEETGFEGMYELLAQYKNAKDLHDHTSIHFDKTTSILQVKGPHKPLFWSLDNKRFMELDNGKIALESGDFFFLFNEGTELFFREIQIVQDLLTKVLKIFAQDGLETTAAMIQKEILFASKKRDPVDDLHLLCFQIL